MKVFIKPYKKGCSGAKELRKALNNAGVPTKGIRPVGSRYANQEDHLVVNWGDSKCPWYGKLLNNPIAVEIATNKLICAQVFEKADVSTPPTYYDKEEVKLNIIAGATVYCRTILNGSKGAGIVIATNVEELVDAQLYTVGITGERTEYRVHVFNGKVVHQQQKKRRNGWKDNPNYSDTVRNLNGGWVFAIKDVEVSEAVKVESIKAVQALGLDFGGVDIVEDANGGVYVIEVNTACGLHGTTIDKYCEAIKAYVEGL